MKANSYRKSDQNLYTVLQRHQWVLGILPALLFFLLFLGGGFCAAIFISFENDLALSPSYVTGWAYRELFTITFLKSLGVTIGMSFVVALLAGIISLMIALLLALKTDKWRWLQILYQLPIGIPHLLAAYMLLQVFTQSGWYSRLAYQLGLVDTLEQFPVLIHDNYGIGIVLAYLWKEVPFLILLLYPFVLRLMAEWTETSKVLGATFGQMIGWIVLPLLLPVWIGGMWIVFAFTLGAYEIPALLGRTSFGFIPFTAWQEYTQFGLERQKIAIAMNVVLAVVSMVVGMVLLFLQRRWYEKGRRIW
ncbi:ABC transporter permease subunit [Calidifontibacillus oryziterrae]|uniref:ABC transporter permease subunit n=1 Tax=Calidifontibacillus oryziterrae TaxID=1191699 RepID=UPI0003093B76|nr:ABC transporter permease subunit [Calidifontibacillus oryziterrae]